jgi:glutamate-5-semialdehyde dehydrogenase
MNRVTEIALRAKAASKALASCSAEQRNSALTAIAEGIAIARDEILKSNQKDLELARRLVESRQITPSSYNRLRLSESGLEKMVAGVRQVAAMGDPIGRTSLARELDQDLELYRVTCPIGLIGVVFESRPDALCQISSLCLKSANAVLLKGGSEAEHTNRVLFDVIHECAARMDIPADALVLLETRQDVADMLSASGIIDLIVPRGSNAFVRHVQENTSIPVLGHSEGICHLYIDRQANVDYATRIALDAKVDYPAACNAIETLLIHRDIAGQLLPCISAEFSARGVSLRCDEKSMAYVPAAEPAQESDWSTEYGDLILSVRVVDSLEEAIDHINTYGSHHTDSIVTEDQDSWRRFFSEVDSAGVYLNASTRFADGYRYGFGAELGISTGKLHPRGPVGLEGLVTYKYKLIGKGHIAAAYSKGQRRFTHRDLD